MSITKLNSFIISNKEIKPNIFEMVINAPEIAKTAKAGQFINIAVGHNDLLLRRPISISSIDDENLTICYRVQGEGTKVLALKKNAEFIDIIGPLGNGFPLAHRKTILLVGGGIGVPPLVELAKQLYRNNKIISLIAFRNEEGLIYAKELHKYGEVLVATEDGTVGYKGNAIDYLEHNDVYFDVVYACGPTVLLKLLEQKYFNKKEGYISFEERMACGIGACYGCVCKSNVTSNGYLRVCKEGPVFKFGEVKYES